MWTFLSQPSLSPVYTHLSWQESRRSSGLLHVHRLLQSDLRKWCIRGTRGRPFSLTPYLGGMKGWQSSAPRTISLRCLPQTLLSGGALFQSSAVKQDEKEAGSWEQGQGFVLGRQGEKSPTSRENLTGSQTVGTDRHCLAAVRIRVPLQKIPFKKASAKRNGFIGSI